MRQNKIKPVSPSKGDRIKQPETDIPSTDYLPPVFSLSHMDKKHCITECEADEKIAFVDQIHLLSQQKWIDLKLAPKHGIGFERIKVLNVKPPQDIKEDAKFIAFRFQGMKAMVGYRDLRIFHIIWIDRDFSVYKH
jgi:hypothetical protein